MTRHDEHAEFVAGCGECAQETVTAGFLGAAGESAQVTCPSCGHSFDPQGEAVRMTESVVTEATFDASKHPRAAAGSSTGGQFAPLSYSAKKNTGSGYGKRGGDKNVTRLQRALNRLKITDSHSRPLKVDGMLGPLTTSAVKKAKQLLGVKPADGRVTPEFLAKLTSTRKLPTAGHAGNTKAKGKRPAAKKPVHGQTSPKQPRQKPRAEVAMNEAADKPYGDVEYADPGLQEDGKQRYPLSDETKVRAAWSYINQAKNAAKYSAADLKKVKAKIRAAAKRLGIQTTESVQAAVEAHVNGSMSFDDIRTAVGKALEKRVVAETGKAYVWCYVADLTTTDVVYACGSDELYQCAYQISENGEVTLGEPEPVVRTYMPLTTADDGMDVEDAEIEASTEASTVEDTDRIESRVVEAKGSNERGGRVFRVRLIAYGDSRNRRRYPESVMRAAAPMYEGAQAYDHHRTDEELRTSTIGGLVGSYRNVEAEADGLYGDLHLLPGATHAAESLDASLDAQTHGLRPLVGLSHDVMATYKPLVAGGKRLQEATSIVKVNSADLVADPAAGGKATRMVAGGEDEQEEDEAEPAEEQEATESGTVPAENEEDEVPPTKDDILGALAEADDDELAKVGLSRVVENDEPEKADEPEVEPQSVTEAAQPKGHWLAKSMIREKVKDAGLPEASVEAVTDALPDRITESDVDHQIAAIKTGLGIVERAGLAPTTTVQVTQEAVDKKKAALDAFFAGKFNEGYYSFVQAFRDFTGAAPRHLGEDFNRTILRESIGHYDSQSRRSTESMDSTSWNLVLGDSITRRMVAEYSQPSLQTWRRIVSSTVPVNDFRTQRIDRVGGYGTLPTVNQSGVYQPLTSPTNEEVTYALAKKGGTEDITLEMIANDDVRAISNIPKKLGLAAAQTLYRFVWDFLRTNPTIYDGTALFHSSHANLAGADAALSQSALSAARVAMRQQTAYGDTSDVLSIVPKVLVVPSVYEEIAFQLTKSAVAVPSTPAGPSDTPNIHAGSEYIVVDYFDGSATGNWFLVCDPNQCPTIEIGFYQGRDMPELFTQNDQTVGSMFDRDAVTYKIRHIYSGAVLDFRGFYRTGIP
jgi:hypothetical protein